MNCLFSVLYSVKSEIFMAGPGNIARSVSDGMTTHILLPMERGIFTPRDSKNISFLRADNDVERFS